MIYKNNMGAWAATGGLLGSIAGLAHNNGLVNELLSIEYGVFGNDVSRSRLEVGLDLLAKSLDEILIGSAVGLLVCGTYKIYKHCKSE
jgi:hypothetical protein